VEDKLKKARLEENYSTAVRFHKAVKVCSEDEYIWEWMNENEDQQLTDQDMMASIILNMMTKTQ
jgi:hypothetical protein